jgi:hypothetical protein
MFNKYNTFIKRARNAYTKRVFWIKQNPLTEIQVAQEAIKDHSFILSEKVQSCITYPKTTTLVYTWPRVSFDNGLDLEELLPFIDTRFNDETSKSLSLTLNMMLAVVLLKRFEQELHSHKADMIQICKDKILVLCICNKPNMKKVLELVNKTPFEQMGYSVSDLEKSEHLDISIHMDIDSLKSCLYEHYTLKMQRRHKIACIAILLTCLLGVLFAALQWYVNHLHK